MFKLPGHNRLQRKITAVILVIVVVPTLVTGIISAGWVSRNFERSIEGWIREAAQVNENWLQTLQRNGLEFGNLLAHSLGYELRAEGVESIPIPRHLAPVLEQMGLDLVQIYDSQQHLLYSSPPVQTLTSWERGQREAVLKVRRDGENLLAALAITPLPQRGATRYYLAVGSLLGRQFLVRLSGLSGLETRLFYPEGRDYARAFSETGRPLKVRVGAEGFAELQHQRPYYSMEAENGRYRGLYTPIVDSTGRLEAVLFSGLPTDGIDAILTNKLTLSAVIVLLGSLVGLVAGVLLSRFVVRPVEDLRDGALQLAARNLRAEVPVRSKDELGELAMTFNAMAASLRQARDEQEQEFRRDKLTALGELSMALAHEIRNPIGVINTATSMLVRCEDRDKRAELVRMAREESQRLNRLLQDFQRLARHRRPKLAVIDPVFPLDRALHTLLAERDDVEIRRRLGHGGLTVAADVDLLQQAWVNLVNNALQAMGDGTGTLTISSGRDGATVWLALEDSGPGLAVEVIPRLFEPFYTTKDSGSGLGLSIANTLVEANGGRLELMPSEGGGARFAMRLPLSEGLGDETQGTEGRE